MNGPSAHFTRVSSLIYQMTLVRVLPFHPLLRCPLGFHFFFLHLILLLLTQMIRNHRARFLTSLSENMPVMETLKKKMF